MALSLSGFIIPFSFAYDPALLMVENDRPGPGGVAPAFSA